MTKNYDHYYAVLRLPKGADHNQIQESWKHWATLLHPDNYTNGKLKNKAQMELREVNVARDELRTWWQEHSCPPPSTVTEDAKTNKGTEAVTDQTGTKTKEQEPRPSADEEDEEYEDEEYDDEEPSEEELAELYARINSFQQDKSEEDLPPLDPSLLWFSAPEFKKKWHHHVYDVLDYGHSEAEMPAFLLGALGLTAPFIASSVASNAIAQVITLPYEATGCLNLVLGFSIAIPYWLSAKADWDLYKIQVNPIRQECALDSRAVLEKITAMIEGKFFASRKWHLESENLEPAHAVLRRNWKTTFANQESQYEIELNVRVKETAPGESTASYWFDIKKSASWLPPLRDLIKSTDETLWKGLKNNV